MTEYEYHTALLNHGFERIGGGLYSEVFSRPGWGYAIKVGRGDDWTDYIEWATQAGYAGTFAPKVYSLKFHPDGWYVAIMERLVDTVTGTADQHGRSPFNDLYKAIRHWAHYNQSEAPELDHPDLQAFSEALRERGFNSDLHGGNMMIRKDGQIVVTDPSSHQSFRRKLRIKNGVIHTPSKPIK